MTDDELKNMAASLFELHRTSKLKSDAEFAELRALLKEGWERQNRTDEQMRRTDAELKELFKRTDEQIKETDEQMKRTDEQIRKTDEQMKRTDEQIKKTDEQMKHTDEKLKRIGVLVGGISKNQGDVAEEFFFNSLLKDNRLGDIRFDDITKHMEKHRGKIQEEYDLFMTNGDAVAVVEVKYKAHVNDLDKLDRKVRNFKKLFPIYKNYKLYAALASFHVNDDARAEALKRGYFVLQRRGKLIHAEPGDTATAF